MQPSTKMQQVVSQLAEKYEVDLTVPGTRLKLTQSAYEPFVIQVISPVQIEVAHYFLSNGQLIPDPYIELYTKLESGWIPISIMQTLGGMRTYARVDEDDQLIVLDLPGQAELAGFTNYWAQNIMDQRWLTDATLGELPSDPQSLVSEPLFAMGQIVMTRGAEEVLEKAEQSPSDFLFRHCRGDWGDLGEEDKQENDRALKEGNRLLSAYTTGNQVRVWLITEWDRSITTILLPGEY